MTVYNDNVVKDYCVLISVCDTWDERPKGASGCYWWRCTSLVCWFLQVDSSQRNVTFTQDRLETGSSNKEKTNCSHYFRKFCHNQKLLFCIHLICPFVLLIFKPSFLSDYTVWSPIYLSTNPLSIISCLFSPHCSVIDEAGFSIICWIWHLSCCRPNSFSLERSRSCRFS